MNAVGANGDYYSSSSNAAGSINVGYLWFNAGNVNPLNGNNRAYARAVRCVQASAEAACPALSRNPCDTTEARAETKRAGNNSGSFP